MLASLQGPQGSGQRFADDTRRLMDQIAGGTGAFRHMEDVVTAMTAAEARARPPAAVTATGRLTCAREHATIYEPGDSWLLQYSFQKGFLWRRNLEVSSRGVLALELASLQNEAKYACTGQLSGGELANLREVLASSRPCEITGPEPRGRDDHAYVSVNPEGAGGVACRYHPLREDDLLDSSKGRRFDAALTTLVAAVAGPGGIDPFDPDRGLLVATAGKAPSRGGASPPRAPHRAGRGLTFAR